VNTALLNYNLYSTLSGHCSSEWNDWAHLNQGHCGAVQHSTSASSASRQSRSIDNFNYVQCLLGVVAGDIIQKTEQTANKMVV